MRNEGKKEAWPAKWEEGESCCRAVASFRGSNAHRGRKKLAEFYDKEKERR